MAKRKAKETKVKTKGAPKKAKHEGAEAKPAVTTAAKPQREVRNGVKRPREGGLCAAVWAALDSMHAAGVVPTAKDVRELATAKGWNQSNASIEFYQWKRFMGMSQPRVMPKRKRAQAKQAAPAVITEAAVS
jgi:hypothetical protein